MSIRKIIAAAAACTAAAVSVLNMSVSAYDPGNYPLGTLDPSESEIRPEITVDMIELTPEEAEAAPLQTININVSGADEKYAAFGFHVVYDERLIAQTDSAGNYAAAGEAAADMEFRTTVSADNTVFVTAASTGNKGKDGTIVSMSFMLPSGVKAGDTFDVGIEYRRAKKVTDCFIDYNDSEAGRLMEAWAFTEGVKDGGIKIVEKHSVPARTPGDANCDTEVNMADAVLIMQALSNPDTYGLGKSEGITDRGWQNADVVGGGDGVTNLDAQEIQSFKLGLVDKLE